MPKELRELLPSDEELATLHYKNDEWALSSESQPLPRDLYKLFMTTSIVVSPTSADVDFLRKAAVFNAGVPGHSSLRSRRVFKSIHEAIEIVAPKDIIYLSPGDYAEPHLQVTKPLTLLGTIKRRLQGQRHTNVLHTVVKFPLDVKTHDLVNKFKIFGLCVQGAGYLEVTDSSVSARRIIFGAEEGRIILNDGADVTVRNCSFMDNETAIDIRSLLFKTLRMELVSFEDNFGPKDLTLILDRLSTAVNGKESGSQVVAALVSSVVAGISSPEIIRCILQKEVVPLLHRILNEYKTDRHVIIDVFKALHKLLCLKIKEVSMEVSKVNFLPLLESIVESLPDDAQVQFLLCAVGWWLVNTPEYRRHFRNTRIWHLEMDLLKRYAKDIELSYKIMSLFWHGSHHLEPVKPILLNAVPTICTIMDNFPDHDTLQMEACGAMWNFSHDWPHELVVQVLPRVLHALNVCRDMTSIDSMLGFFAKLLGSCQDDDLNFLVEKDAITLFFELIQKFDKDGSADDPRAKTASHLWKIISSATKHPKARDVLAEKISKSRKFSLLTDSQMISIVRLLCRQSQVPESVYKALSKALRKFDDVDTYFLAMDALVCLHTNDRADVDEQKVTELSAILFSRAEKFLVNSRFATWFAWSSARLQNEAIKFTSYHLDPALSPEIIIATDGVTCRHDFQGFFGSGIGIKAVSTGKWYYEFELLNNNLYQVGWVNDLYKSNPTEGKGVGDCSFSWAVDLYRNAKWHEQEDGLTSRLPYGVGHSWSTGGVLGCYLNLDENIMWFTYDGEDLGVAFDDFKVGRGMRPGFSTHLQQEARFNFGAKPFRHPPAAGYNGLVLSYFQ